MLKNPFKPKIAHDDAAPSAPEQSEIRTPDGAPPEGHARNPPNASPEEMRDWRDRVRMAQSDDATLLQLAHQMPGVELKLAAIEALTHEDAFRRAMREFGDQDKRLYRAAKAGWQAASGKRKAAAKADALIAAARGLLEQDVVPVNRAVELDREWAALDPAWVDAGPQSEFAALSAALGARARAQGEGEQAIARWLAAADDASGRILANLPAVAQGDLPPAAAESLAANLLELAASAPAADDPRCIEKADAANRMLALASGVVQRAAFLLSLPAPAATGEALEKERIEQWRGIPEVAEAPLQSALAGRFADWRNACLLERQQTQEARRAREREQTAERKQRRLSAIEGDVAAAEAAHAAGHVAELTRLMAGIERALKAGAASPALARRIDTLRREEMRLRDWQRWSGRQGREQLVGEAQALATAANGKVALKAQAEAIQKLREGWKELDKLGGASNQALWLAFDGALKAAYAPVAAHLEQLKAARKENLDARNRVIDDLVQSAAQHLPPPPADAVSPPPAVPDWRAIARTVHEARIAWRKLGPVAHTVPRKSQEAVSTRFAEALRVLQTPLEKAYRDAAREREALIAAATNLMTPEGVARDAVDKVRKLQAQWQQHAKSLPLPRHEENALWTTFKSATDAVFIGLDAARTAKEVEFGARIKAREEIIDRLAQASGPAPEIKRAMAEAETAWRASAEVARPQAGKLDARYRAARDAAAKRLRALAVQASQSRYDALAAAMALCQERESSGDEAADWDGRWNAIENLPDAWRAKLEERFRESAPRPGGAERDGSRERLAETLLQLEAACGIDSPPQFLPDRQQLKLRALKEAMEARRASVATQEDIERWLLDAAAAKHPDELTRDRLAKIIAAARHSRGDRT